MAMGKSLSSEGMAWGVLAVVIVLMMIIINKISTSSTVTGLEPTVNTSIQTLGSDFITGLSEPKNWVAIVVIALVGFGIIKYMSGKR